jgi:hypothetical protein
MRRWLTIAGLAAILSVGEAVRADLVTLQEVNATIELPDDWELNWRQRQTGDLGVRYRLMRRDPALLRQPLPYMQFVVGRGQVEIATQTLDEFLRGRAKVELSNALRASEVRDLYVVTSGETRLAGLPAYFAIAEATPIGEENRRLRAAALIACDNQSIVISTMVTYDDLWDSSWSSYKFVLNSFTFTR